MAKLFLESTDTSYKVSSNNTTVFGATGDQAITIDAGLTAISLDANVERVQFTGATTDYKYVQAGTDLKVYNAAGALVTTVGLQDDATGTQLTFANGTVKAAIVATVGAAPTLSVGGTAVTAIGATATPVAVVPATIDGTVSSAPAAVFSVSAPTTSVTEATGATASFTVSLNAAQPAATTVKVATGSVGGSAATLDYGLIALTPVTGGATLDADGTVHFPAGITTATITVPVVVDSIAETGEGVSLTLSSPNTGATVGTATATVSIADPATPIFSLSAATTSIAEGTPIVGTAAAIAAGTDVLTITRSGNTTGANSVVIQSVSGTGTNGAISGSDFTAISQTISFAAGETTKTVTLSSIADANRESNETLTVALSTPSAGSSISSTASSVTVTINDDDLNQTPVITVPTTTPSAFIGSSATLLSGVQFTDADDNTGFTVTVQAAGASQVSFSTATGVAGALVKNTAGVAVANNETANTLVITGVKDAVNTILNTLSYTSNSTIPTTESVTITVADSVGGTTGTATKTMAVNVGQSGELKLSASDSLLGSSGDDIFKLASTATFADLTTADTINGGLGNDRLTLTGVNSTVVGTISNVEVLDLTLTGSSTVTVSATNFGSALNTINYTSGTATLGATVNAGTTFNFVAAAPGALTVTNVLVPSTSVASTVLTDAITVNLNGGVTLSSITDSAATVDVLNINSNGTGTTVNVLTTLNNLAAAANVNIAGSQQLTIGTLPTTTGVISGATATGKLILTAGASATTVIGGLSGDSITGGAGADSLSGGAGNDTISGGTSTTTNTITGGTGVDSLTGGSTGVDTFVFTPGDTGSTSTTRDTLVDLKEFDVIKMGGYLISSLANGATLPTSASSTTTKEIYIDATNKLLVIETAADGSTVEQINIPPSVANATFTYSYGADSVVGTADDLITVGAAPFAATNNGLGVLTLTGKSISTAAVVLDNGTSAVIVNGSVTGSNGINTIVASTVTSSGVTVTATDTATTGTVRGLTITDSLQNDTINLTTTANAGTYVDTLNITGGTNTVTNFGSGVDIIKVSSGATANVALVAGTPSWVATASTTNAGTLTIGSGNTGAAGVATTTVTVDLSLVTTNTGTVNIDVTAGSGVNGATLASQATTLKGTGAGVTNIKGGSAVDTITAAVGGGSITGGAGADVITGGAGADIVIYATTNAATSGIAFTDTGTTGSTVSTPDAGDTYAVIESITGLVTGDSLNLGNASAAAHATTLAADKFLIVQGAYAGGTFTVGTGLNTGADSLLIWDDSAVGGATYSAVVLVGVTSAEEANIVNTAGVLTIFGA